MAAGFFHMHSRYWVPTVGPKVCGRFIGGAAHTAQVKGRVFTTRFPAPVAIGSVWDSVLFLGETIDVEMGDCVNAGITGSRGSFFF